jgi:hypothetical protein
VKLEREVAQLDQLERREVLEERVRRDGRRDRVAGIAEELEEKRVRLARRRRDHDVAGIASEVLRDCVARNGKAERLGLVRCARRPRHRLGELIERVVEPRARRIRIRQIEQRAAVLCARDGESVLRCAPVRAA